MSSYRPASRQHAIEQAVVGIRVFTPVSEDRFQNVILAAGELAKKHNLPGRIQLDPMSLVFGRQVISHGLAAPLDVTPGMLYQRVNDNGSMAEELTIERNAVTYRTRNYRRWSDVIDILRGIVCPVAAELTENDPSQISVVEFRCVDRFTTEAEARPILSELIRSDTPYIMPVLLNHRSQLHVHSGWFEGVSDEERTLINMNLDVSDKDDSLRTATILQAISWQAAQPGVFKGVGTLDERVIDKFNDLHLRDKKMLSELLTDEIQISINLSGADRVA